MFGGDLAKFVREGNTRGIFKNRTVVSLLSGEPEYLDPLKDEAPVGWIVTGYPWDKIKTPAHLAFVKAYQAKYHDYPRLGSIVGYMTIKSLAAGIAKAKSTDTEKLVAAFKGLKVDSPFGPFSYRASDHQATMGAYVGKIALENGKGTMVDFKYVDGASVLPSDAEVKKLRPAGRIDASALTSLPRWGEGGRAQMSSCRVGYPPMKPSTRLDRLPRHLSLRGGIKQRSMTLAAFLFQALNGLSTASGLFFVAAGLSLIFGVTRIVNIAHGSLYMLGTYIAYSFATRSAGRLGSGAALL